MKKLIFITIFLGFFTTIYAESVCNLSGQKYKEEKQAGFTFRYKFCFYTCPDGKVFVKEYDLDENETICPSFVRIP